MAEGEGGGGTILSWNTANWITVTLMAAIGFFLLGLAQSYWRGKQGDEQPA